MKIPVYNLEGKEVEKIELSDAVFSLKPNDDLIHQVFSAMTANQREVLAHTKNRGERAGSGIKPWRQKGTGRARVGSVRNPLWKKGGVAFGPRKDRNYSQKINKKMNAKAIQMVIAGKIKDEELKVVDKLVFETNKTKEVAKAVTNLKLKGKTLVAFSAGEKKGRLASRNIKNVTNIMTDQLNVADMLGSKFLLLSKESIETLEKKYKA